MIKVLQFLLVLQLLFVSQSLLQPQPTYAQQEEKSRDADVQKLIEYVKQTYPVQSSPKPLVDEYVSTLIIAKKFDEAFEAFGTLSRNTLVSNFDQYCRSMRSAYQIVELAEQVAKLESRSPDRFQTLADYQKNKLKLYRAEAEVMLAIEQSDIPKATDLFFELSTKDERYFVNAIQEKHSKLVTREFIESIVARTPPKKRARTEERLWNYTKPKPREFYGSNRQRRSLELGLKKFEELKELKMGSRSQWLNEATFWFGDLPHETQLQHLGTIFNVLEEENWTPEEISDYRWRMLPTLIEHKNWDVILDTLKSHSPNPGSVFYYHQLLTAVKANAPTRLKEFVDQLPNANEASPYDMRLINFLLNTGFINKAEKNVDSLEARHHDHGRLKVDFYKTLQDTDFKDVNKIKAAYHKVVEDAAKSNFINHDFGLLEQTLGFEHLAMIASRGGPEIALQASRVMPPEPGTRFGDGKPANALSKCLLGLLLRKEYDLAVKVGKLATPEEREETQLGISDTGLTGGDWAHEIDSSVWASLQEFAPNDLTVVNGATQNAIVQKDKKQALELARHQMLRNRRSSNGSMFAKAGWADDYLAVAKEVHDSKADDPDYRDHRELQALKMVLAMDFNNAEEAITFSQKHLSQPKYKAQFILELAKDWASPACCGKAPR